MTRIAVLLAAALLLVLPSGATAHDPSTDVEAASIGMQHMRMHLKIRRAQERGFERWRKMSRAERRRASRRQMSRELRSFARARAAADATPSDVGEWAAPFVMTSNYEGYAIHAAMLHTGKVLMWGYPVHPDQGDAWRGNETYAWLWDPSKGYGSDAVEDVTPVIGGDNVSIYCSGMSFLADGRLLVVGGTLTWAVNDPDFPTYNEFAGLNRAILFDPATETWSELPRPTGSHGRWYPTQTLLPDGRTFVISGLSDVEPGGLLNDTVEIYGADGTSPTLLDSAPQRRSTELYPHVFTMPDGDLLLAGPNPDDSARFDLDDLADPWTDLPDLSGQRIGGNAVLLPEGPAGSSRVAEIGGRPYGQLPPATNEMIDLDDASPAWSSFPALSVQRSYPNTVLLPDRSMVAIGGDDRIEQTWPLVPEKAVELYDPVTNSWRSGPSQVEKRAYHSTAVLLPDGRVLSTGDDLNPTSDGTRPNSSPNDTGEVYSPPYLFQGPRPVITSAPDAVGWDVPFAVGTSDVDDAVLIAPAATTHANDMNQRLVPLRIVAQQAGGVTLQSPPSAAVAPPGWYMLFGLKDGVPSVAEWVLLSSTAGEVPVVPPPPDPGGPGSGGDGGDREPDSPSVEDSTAPALEVAYAKRRWLRRLRHDRVLRIRVTLDERAAVDARLLRKTKRVGRERAELRAGTHRLELAPRRRTLRWLRRTEHPRLRLSVFATDGAGNETAWTRRLRR